MRSSSSMSRIVRGLLVAATATSLLSVALAGTISVKPGGLQSALDNVSCYGKQRNSPGATTAVGKNHSERKDPVASIPVRAGPKASSCGREHSV